MSPAARASRSPPPGLTSPLNAAKLCFCRRLQEEASGSTSCVGPEADATEPEAPGPQPEERLPGEDPGPQAPGRDRRRRLQGRAEAAVRDRGRDRPRGQEGRRPRQRRVAVQEPALAQGQRAGRGEGLSTCARLRRAQALTIPAVSAVLVSAPVLMARS